MSARLEAWAAARRILVVRLDAMGDVLMTTPAIRALSGVGRPFRRSITLLTSASGAAVASLIPEVDDAIVASPPWLKGEPADETGLEQDVRGTERLVARLRAGGFDAAVICTVNTQSALPSALICLLAGIPMRLAHARENPYRLVTDWVPDPEPIAPLRHEVRRQLDLVATIGATVEDEHLSIRVPPGAIRAIRPRVEALGIGPGERWVVVHPGANAPSRRYPIDSFATVVRSLAGEHGVRVVIAGGGADAAVLRGLRDTAGAGVSVIEGLDLQHLAALLSVAPVVVANNSGPAHLAAAVGTPVVDLYALTNLQHAPWAVPSRILAHDVPCKGCRKSVCPVGHHACLQGVSPASVVAGTLELLDAPARVVAPPAGILPGIEAPVA